jgi:hypothetical protein
VFVFFFARSAGSGAGGAPGGARPPPDDSSNPVVTVPDDLDALILPPLNLPEGVTAAVALPDGTPVLPDENGSYAVPLNGLAPGEYEITITLTDDDGSNETVTFVVKVKEPEIPTPQEPEIPSPQDILDAIANGGIEGVTVTPNEEGKSVITVPDELGDLIIPLPEGVAAEITLPGGTPVEANPDGSFAVPLDDLEYGENEITITFPDVLENDEPVEIVLIVYREPEIPAFADILDALEDGVPGVTVENGVVLAGVDISELPVFDIPPGFTVEYWVNEDAKTVSGPATLVIDLGYGENDITITLKDNKGKEVTSFGLTVNREEQTWSIELDKTALVFEPVLDNYTVPPAAQTKTVSNTGNQPAGALSVSVTSDAFVVSPDTFNITRADGQTSFEVQPAAKLAAGNYKAVVKVSDGKTINETFDVSFTVIATGSSVLELLWVDDEGEVVQSNGLPIVLEYPNSIDITAADNGYDNFLWYINDKDDPETAGVSQDGKVYTFNSLGKTGTYRITLEVTKGTIPYSSTVVVTINKQEK